MEQDLQDIINGCKVFNPNKQEALYFYCYAQMFAVCERYTNNRDDAAVLYNQGMLKVLTYINNYEYTGAFIGWVRRIMVNTCIDNCKKEIKYNVVPLDEKYEEQVFVDPSIDDKINSETVLRLIQALPKSTSLVFNLYAIEGFKLDEIAVALNITIGTTKWHVSEARKTLKQQLQQYSKKAMSANE